MSTETIVLNSNGNFSLKINAIIENMAARKLQTYQNKLGKLFFSEDESEGESKSILDRLITKSKVNNINDDNFESHYLDTMMIGGVVENPTDDLSKTSYVNIKHDNSGVTIIHNKSQTESPTAKHLCQSYEDQANKIINDGLQKYKVTHKYDDNRTICGTDEKHYWTINATCTYHIQKVKS